MVGAGAVPVDVGMDRQASRPVLPPPPCSLLAAPQPCTPTLQPQCCSTFKVLTGCQPECAYSVNHFPNATAGDISPLKIRSRNTTTGACPDPPAGTSPIQPTSLVYDGGPPAVTSDPPPNNLTYYTANPMCNSDWQTAYVSGPGAARGSGTAVLLWGALAIHQSRQLSEPRGSPRTRPLAPPAPCRTRGRRSTQLAAAALPRIRQRE